MKFPVERAIRKKYVPKYRSQTFNGANVIDKAPRTTSTIRNLTHTAEYAKYAGSVDATDATAAVLASWGAPEKLHFHHIIIIAALYSIITKTQVVMYDVQWDLIVKISDRRRHPRSTGALGSTSYIINYHNDLQFVMNKQGLGQLTLDHSSSTFIWMREGHLPHQRPLKGAFDQPVPDLLGLLPKKSRETMTREPGYELLLIVLSKTIPGKIVHRELDAYNRMMTGASNFKLLSLNVGSATTIGMGATKSRWCHLMDYAIDQDLDVISLQETVDNGRVKTLTAHCPEFDELYDVFYCSGEDRGLLTAVKKALAPQQVPTPRKESCIGVRFTHEGTHRLAINFYSNPGKATGVEDGVMSKSKVNRMKAAVAAVKATLYDHQDCQTVICGDFNVDSAFFYDNFATMLSIPKTHSTKSFNQEGKVTFKKTIAPKAENAGRIVQTTTDHVLEISEVHQRSSVRVAENHEIPGVQTQHMALTYSITPPQMSAQMGKPSAITAPPQLPTLIQDEDKHGAAASAIITANAAVLTKLKQKGVRRTIINAANTIAHHEKVVEAAGEMTAVYAEAMSLLTEVTPDMTRIEEKVNEVAHILLRASYDVLDHTLESSVHAKKTASRITARSHNIARTQLMWKKFSLLRAMMEKPSMNPKETPRIEGLDTRIRAMTEKPSKNPKKTPLIDGLDTRTRAMKEKPSENPKKTPRIDGLDTRTSRTLVNLCERIMYSNMSEMREILQKKLIIKRSSEYCREAEQRNNAEAEILISNFMKNNIQGRVCKPPQPVSLHHHPKRTLTQSPKEAADVFSAMLHEKGVENMKNHLLQCKNNDNDENEKNKKSEKTPTEHRDPSELDAPITRQEIAVALSGLQNGKSASFDRIPTEFYKSACSLSNTRKSKKPLADGNADASACGAQAESTPIHQYLFRNNKKIVSVNGNLVARKNGNHYNANFLAAYDDSNAMMCCLEHLLNLVFHTGITPHGWRTATISMLHKKGDKADPNNYRPIAGSTALQNVLNKIVSNRIQDQNERGIKLEDDGVRKGRLTRLFSYQQAAYLRRRDRFEHILSLIEFIQHYREKKVMSDTDSAVWVVFVDVKRAFDSVSHSRLIETMEKKLNLTRDSVLLRYVKNMYDTLEYCVKEGGAFSVNQRQQVGIKQGCTLSPLLFNLFFDHVIERIHRTRYGHEMIDLAYADDLAMGYRSKDDLERGMKAMYRALEDLGLEINQAKTQIIKFRHALNGRPCNMTREPSIQVNFVAKVSGKAVPMVFDVVDSYRYLGVEIDYQLSPATMVPNTAFWWERYRSLLQHPHVPLPVKTKVINTHILPQVLRNAPILGMLYNMGPTYSREVENKVFKPFYRWTTQLLRTGAGLKGAKLGHNIWSTTKPVAFAACGIPNPAVYIQNQAAHLASYVIQKTNVNPWMRKYVIDETSPEPSQRGQIMYTPTLLNRTLVNILQTLERVDIQVPAGPSKDGKLDFILHKADLTNAIPHAMMTVIRNRRISKMWVIYDEKGEKVGVRNSATESGPPDDECKYHPHRDVKEIGGFSAHYQRYMSPPSQKKEYAHSSSFLSQYKIVTNNIPFYNSIAKKDSSTMFYCRNGYQYTEKRLREVSMQFPMLTGEMCMIGMLRTGQYPGRAREKIPDELNPMKAHLYETFSNNYVVVNPSFKNTMKIRKKDTVEWTHEDTLDQDRKPRNTEFLKCLQCLGNPPSHAIIMYDDPTSSDDDSDSSKWWEADEDDVNPTVITPPQDPMDDDYHILVECPHRDALRKLAWNMTVSTLRNNGINLREIGEQNSETLARATKGIIDTREALCLEYRLALPLRGDATDLIMAPTSGEAERKRAIIHPDYDIHKIAEVVRYWPEDKHDTFMKGALARIKASDQRMESAIGRNEVVGAKCNKAGEFTFLLSEKYLNLYGLVELEEEKSVMNSFLESTSSKTGAAGYFRKRITNRNGMRELYSPRGDVLYQTTVFIYLAYLVRLAILNTPIGQ